MLSCKNIFPLDVFASVIDEVILVEGPIIVLRHGHLFLGDLAYGLPEPFFVR